jgi:NADH dehydrogenase (ubiquinone) 1 alpha subcomplex subunit 2
MKQSNPHTPIMIREALGIEPKVYARYEFGRERVADLKGEIGHNIPSFCACRRVLSDFTAGLDASAIEQKISSLIQDGPQ